MNRELDRPLPSYLDHQPPPRNRTLAIASLVVGVVSCFTLGLLVIGSIAGILMGRTALDRARSDPEHFGGKDLAITGIVACVISLVITAAVVAGVLIIPRHMAVNHEIMAQAQLQLISQAEQICHVRTGSYTTLDELESRGYIFQLKFMEGYNYRVDASKDWFEGFATPKQYPTSGVLSFYTSVDGQVRGADKQGKDASPSDPVVLKAPRARR